MRIAHRPGHWPDAHVRTRPDAAQRPGSGNGICRALRSRESPGSGDASSPAWRQCLALARLPAGTSPQRIDMGEPPGSAAGPTPTDGRSCVSTEQRENLEAILRQSAFPADVGLDRAAAAAARADLGAAAARRGDRDRRRAGRRPHRRDHHRRNRTPPRCPVLPRRRVRAGGRLPGRWPGLAGRPADRAPGSSPSTTGSPPSTRIRQRSTTLSPPTKPSWTTARPLRTSPSRESPPAAGSPSPPWSTPAITGCPCPPRPSSCPRMPTSPWPGRPWTLRARSTC